ncbi:unnamed protein product [Linum tenue]|uniref:Uncharacterized protein n=1 Tax=Linum tenue TaxID=586396 RepID=A0AAV0QJS6_9ROSI|nr:unnamed protein product [Linum tenue]
MSLITMAHRRLMEPPTGHSMERNQMSWRSIHPLRNQKTR